MTLTTYLAWEMCMCPHNHNKLIRMITSLARLTLEEASLLLMMVSVEIHSEIKTKKRIPIWEADGPIWAPLGQVNLNIILTLLLLKAWRWYLSHKRDRVARVDYK